MSNNVIKKSLLLKIAFKGWDGYVRAILWLEHAYEHSMVCGAGKILLNAFRACMLSKAIGSILKSGKNALAVNDSLIVNWATKACGRVKQHIAEFMVTSKVIAAARIAQNDIFINPFRSIGIIILAAVITNISISLLMSKQFSFLGWLMRANLMLIAILWVSCKLELDELKKNSLFFKKFRPGVKI